MIKKTSILSVLVLMAMQPVSATVLTFSDLNVGSAGAVPDTYGDNVTATSDVTGSYLEGAGFTPNVTVAYQVFDLIADEYLEGKIEYFTTGGDLRDVIYTQSNASYGEITLTPENGFVVVLNSFDMATDHFGNGSIETLQVIDANKTVLWDSGVSNIPDTDSDGKVTHDTFTPNISSAGAITIRWGKNRQVSIDNISFHQQKIGEEVQGSSECLAEYKEDGSLYIPCVVVPDGTVYKATMQILPPENPLILNPLIFELTGAEKR